MYEEYTRQSLPSRRYRELLGSALCVFNSNNAFIIENILKVKVSREDFDWYELIDKQSGELKPFVKRHLSKDIYDLFENVVERRNRIIHSFQVTQGEEQILCTKNREHKQFIIDEKYLLQFIKDNELLSIKLHEFRGY